MTYFPGVTFPVPPSTVSGYSGGSPAPSVLGKDEAPMIYTTSGPLPIVNGIAVSRTAITFDPNEVLVGSFDSGIFGI